ncbi:lamin tail domain-containing protein [Actinoplanes utahensis]|uniref:LTD domain-containing protein n=1 Tax=Actinoplanes utahensis TaxID=1869 RepID=A0A0A6UR47_ACTUT|nr:lamin tail domain-containing protein [Actinoplanes utahensis]KHD77513.1 hypothetical protein MB27_10415 [Actinoplanes utahensis]GIF32669.1 hypothetical protein Aut01nite_56550 [Actinoplanes utahensis]
MRRLLPAITAVTIGAVTGLASPAQAAPALRFHSAQYDSPGTDTRTVASLNAEWISLVNSGSTAVDLTGWRIHDKSRTYTFGKVRIPARGGRLWLHTGKGADSGTRLYWNSGNYVWNNTGDTATLLTRTGATHHTCTWAQRAGRTVVGC